MPADLVTLAGASVGAETSPRFANGGCELGHLAAHLLVLFVIAFANSAIGQGVVHSNDRNRYTVLVPPGLSSIANHLNNGGNTLAEVLPKPPEGTILYKFDSDRQIYTVNPFQWGTWVRPTETLAPGEGALIRNPGSSFEITFSGTKPANAAFPQLRGGYNLVSLPVPGETNLPVPKPGDQIVRYDALNGTFRFHTFDDLDYAWIPSLGLIERGEAFFYRAAGPSPPGAVVGGTVYFSNYNPPSVNARMTFADGTGLGEGWTAELYVDGRQNSGLQFDWQPLTPATTFQTSSAASRGYVHPIVVAVPGVPPGAQATLKMRMYNGETFQTSTAVGEMNPITVTLGGGILPPADLTGLMPNSFLGHMPPRIIQAPQHVTMELGAQAVFEVGAAGPGPFSYQWFKNGLALAGKTNATLVLNNIQAADAGGYSVRVTNSFGSATSFPAVLAVRDSTALILLQDAAGSLAVWKMNGAKVESGSFLEPHQVSVQWRLCGAGDFDVDGQTDVLFQHDDSSLAVWLMDGPRVKSATLLNPRRSGVDWRVVSVGDFNSDGKTDLIFQRADGTLAAWLMNGTELRLSMYLDPNTPGDANWKVVGGGDMDGDRKNDLVFQHRDGSVAVWFLEPVQTLILGDEKDSDGNAVAWFQEGLQMTRASLTIPGNSGDWRVVGVTDLNADGKADLLFQHPGTTDLAVWFMNGFQLAEGQLLNPSQPGGTWKIAAPK